MNLNETVKWISFFIFKIFYPSTGIDLLFDTHMIDRVVGAVPNLDACILSTEKKS